MKKKLLCFLLAMLCILPLALVGCTEEEEEELTSSDVKPMTITLYGITGEGTTEEAIKKVEEEINKYTEGKFTTHVILRLFPEDEYYAEIDRRLAEAEAQRLAEEAAKKDKDKNKTTTEVVSETETDAETYFEHGVTQVVYPTEKGTQIDIFMVQGATNLHRYADTKRIVKLNDSLNNSSKILRKYISGDMFTTVTIGGTALPSGLYDKGDIYGVPNNYVTGEYTYLLINKELASQYFYTPADLNTLDSLANYLDDASKHSDYITLYNEPTIGLDYLTEEPSLVGGVWTSASYIFSPMIPRDILNISAYTNYLQSLYDYHEAGYVVKGDMSALPTDENGNEKKVAAAFLKGNAALPEQYEDDYYVVTYQKPFARATDRPGTVFCVSAYAANVDRCMEVITALQIDPEFRNTFQYGVEDVHYRVDEYTGEISILNQDYQMDPADTGNLFLLTPNTSMSEEMKALAANDWALGKQQYRDTISSPYTIFDFRVITEDNYKTDSPYYLALYEEAYEAAKDIAKAEAKAENKKFDEAAFKASFEFDAEYPYEYTDTILENLLQLSKEMWQQIDEFEEYTDENGKVVTLKNYIRTLRTKFDTNKWYKMLIDSENPDSPLSQYNAWREKYGPKVS